MSSVMVVLIGSVIGCLIGGVLGYLGYKVGRAVESRMWLLAEVIWLRKTPPGVALYERQVALAHVGKLSSKGGEALRAAISARRLAVASPRLPAGCRRRRVTPAHPL